YLHSFPTRRSSDLFEGQSPVGVGRAINGLGPAPQVHTTRHTTDGFHVDRPLGIDSVTGFQALHDEGEGTQASGNGSQLRQAQALIGAETVAARADKGRNRFGATARAGLAGAGVLV